MIRVFLFFVIMAALAFGAAWIADRPGEIVLTWQGYQFQTSLFVGLGILLAAVIALMIVWSALRFIFRIPSIMAFATRARRRNKGFAALSRGMIAVGAGDSKGADKQAREASRLLGHEPLPLLLKAQAAQLSGNRPAAEAHFTSMLDLPETRVLGLRGLHIEAHRRGDAEAAVHFAAEAQKIAALPWAGQAVLSHRASRHDWAGALAAVEANASAKLIDRPAAARQRAVLKTALALEKSELEPEAALALAREAVKLAPGLVPAAALAARLLTRRGDMRKAARIIEAAFTACPHPDLSEAYLNVRQGDSAADRLARARTLAKLAPDHAESRLAVARAALDAREFDTARTALEPLLDTWTANTRPTVRLCLLMAELEETANSSPGHVREWLTRAAHAARDPAWIADGVASDEWAPVSPVTGRLDAYIWETPREQLARAPSDFSATIRAPRADSVKSLEPAPAPPAPVESTATEVALEPPARSALTPAPAAPTPRPVIFPLPKLPDDPGLSAIDTPPRGGAESMARG